MRGEPVTVTCLGLLLLLSSLSTAKLKEGECEGRPTCLIEIPGSDVCFFVFYSLYKVLDEVR